jgi:hypothetical protein
MKKFKIVGISDDQNVCECCGKKNLKKVIHLEDIETGYTVAYGVVCAAKVQKITVREQTADIRLFENKNRRRACKEIWPFKLRQLAAYEEAPNDFNDPDHYQKRKNFLDNDQRVIEYREKKAEISKKYNVEPWKIA